MAWRLAGAALLLACLVEPAAAVDRSKFRTCEQGSFCRRFRRWIQRPNREEALWSVLPDSKASLPDGGWSFKVKHRSEAEPHLELLLNAYASGVIRMRVNEIDALHVRHVIPAGDAIADPPPAPATGARLEQTAAATVVTFTAHGVAIKASLKHSPMALEVSADGQVLQRLNGRNYFNFERYRRAKAELPPDSASDKSASPGEVTLDAAALPGVDKHGLWEEDFGGHKDRKPRGPASLGMDVTFEGDVPSLFGLPEHMTKASLPFYEEPYRFFNLDVFEYENDEPMALYGAVPLLWAIHRGSFGAKSLTSAFLWTNPSETFVKLEREAGMTAKGPAHSWWTSESGVLDVAVLVGPAPAQVSAQFHALTGAAPIPPLWALGKHQCRWNYMSEKDVATVDANYDKHDIPYDVIWLDIEHTDGKAYFTWNSANFPTPEKMTNAISEKRRKFVNVVDPHIKKEDKFHVYTEVKNQGLFVKKVDWRMMDDPTDVKPADWDGEPETIEDDNAVKPEDWNEAESGPWERPKIPNPAFKGEWKARQLADPNSPKTDFEGWCWPGTSLYPDFTDPKMREYWGSQFALGKYKGTNADTYIWNDMNEPSVFNGPEVTMPRDAVHPYGDVEHRDVHNMYGYYVHRATFEGLEKRVPGDRAFVLTRSFFTGSHKYSAIWTGDNYAKWDHLGTSIAMVGALTLAGQSLVGADVGGFFKHPDEEMVARWYQLGALAYPFLRNHAHLETPRREPYVFGDDTMKRVRAALQLRYRMLPLWYTIFEEYHRSGAPVMRPLFWDFLEDPETHADHEAVENQIMLGGDVLVHGVSKPLAEGATATVYLPSPPGGWYDLQTGAFSAPGRHELPLTLEGIPAFYRAGAVVPLKSRVRRSSSCMAQDPHTLNVYLNAAGEAKGRLYVDDYKTLTYKDGRSFLDVEFEFKNGVLKPTAVRGSPPAEVFAQVERVEIFGLKSAPTQATLVAGETRELSQPVSREVPAGPGGRQTTAAVVKVLPWLDLKIKDWSISVK